MKFDMTKRDVLVTILCVFVLMMALGAVGSRGRANAKLVVCQSNIKGMTMALIAFADDNGGEFFGYESSLWINNLADYTDNLDRIRHCPMTEFSSSTFMGWGSSWETWVWTANVPSPAHGSYGYNGWLYGEDPGWVGYMEYMFGNLGNIELPNLTPVFFDANWTDAWPRDTDTVPVTLDLDYGSHGYDAPVTNHMQRLMLNRHFGVCNVGFVDGHVEPVELGRLWGLKWHRQFEIYDGIMTRIDGSPIY